MWQHFKKQNWQRHQLVFIWATAPTERYARTLSQITALQHQLLCLTYGFLCFFFQSAHLALIDTLMMAYTVETVSVEKVVACLQQYSTMYPDGDTPYDTEDAITSWMNKVASPWLEYTYTCYLHPLQVMAPWGTLQDQASRKIPQFWPVCLLFMVSWVASDLLLRIWSKKLQSHYWYHTVCAEDTFFIIKTRFYILFSVDCRFFRLIIKFHNSVETSTSYRWFSAF